MLPQFGLALRPSAHGEIPFGNHWLCCSNIHWNHTIKLKMF